MIVVDDHAINIIENKPEQENEFYIKTDKINEDQGPVRKKLECLSLSSLSSLAYCLLVRPRAYRLIWVLL